MCDFQGTEDQREDSGKPEDGKTGSLNKDQVKARQTVKQKVSKNQQKTKKEEKEIGRGEKKYGIREASEHYCGGYERKRR